MQSAEDVKRCYDVTAAAYATQFFGELEHKHLDRILLRAFAEENAGKGRMADLGCGPGQTTVRLQEYGANQLVGIDFSEEMIKTARALSPGLAFETGDLLDLQYADATFGSATAFYAIVHFTTEQLTKALQEVYRVLQPAGHFLLSFHVGTTTFHHDTFLGAPVPIDFFFWETENVLEIAKQAGFGLVDCIERRPYTGVEYPSTRAYVWLKK